MTAAGKGLLPNGWGRGFAIGAGGALGVFETQLRRDGYMEVAYQDGKSHWAPFLPWLANVNRRLFAPGWLYGLDERHPWLTRDGVNRERLIAFLQGGSAHQRAQALLAAVDLAGVGDKDRVIAADILMAGYAGE